MTAPGKETLQILLVDDERLARKRMKELLKAHPELAVAGEAGDLASARAFFQERAPDVVFLDIDMPPGNGFDLLPAVPAVTEVVFVTAHDAFAVRAFEANALDYLLKPVHPDRLATCVERLLSRLRPKPESSPREIARPYRPYRLAPADPLVVRDGQTWRQLEPAGVLAIQGDGSYTRVYSLDGDTFLVLKTLNQWMEILPESHFARLNRSLVVNLSRVKRLDILNRDLAKLYLDGWSEALTLGRVASRQLRRELKGYSASNR